MRTVFAHAISAAASVGFTILAVAASAPAAAAVDQAPRAIVQTADLDLASAAGRRTALTRIATAASRVCDVPSAGILAVANCRRHAVADATRALDVMSAPTQVAAR